MDKPAISVIVPIYNVSKYLEQCLTSLVKQSKTDIEIILINDQSPDPEDELIAMKFASQDARVKYHLHEQNKGVGGARNTGIEVATASYIGFVDGDDWIQPDMYRKLYASIIETQSDIAQCYFYEYFEGSKKLRKLKRFRKKRDIMNATNVLLWNKLFKRSLFTEHSIRFPENCTQEDLATMPRVLYYVQKMSQVREALYNYRVTRKQSLTSDYDRIFTDHTAVFSVLKQFLVENEWWNRDRIYFEKRLIRTLIHDISRLHKSPLMTEEQKSLLINTHLKSILELLQDSTRINTESITKTLKSLKAEKRRLAFQSFF